MKAKFIKFRENCEKSTLKAAFNFIAMPCETIKEAEEILPNDEFVFNCEQTILTHPDLRTKKLVPGVRFSVRCIDTCTGMGGVMGNKIYSPRSPICAAAYHSGVINRMNIQRNFYIVIGEGMECYYASYSESVSSKKSSIATSYSISFMDANFSQFLPFVNQQIDYKIKGVWKSGNVAKVESNQEGAFVTVTPAPTATVQDAKTGDVKQVGFTWPSSDIDFCGQ